MYTVITCIIFLLIGGGKEDAAADSHSCHAYTYMIAFTCFFLTAILLSCMNCCTFNKVPRSIVDDMYLINMTNVVQYNNYIAHNNMNQIFKA